MDVRAVALTSDRLAREVSESERARELSVRSHALRRMMMDRGDKLREKRMSRMSGERDDALMRWHGYHHPAALPGAGTAAPRSEERTVSHPLRALLETCAACTRARASADGRTRQGGAGSHRGMDVMCVLSPR